MVKVKDYVAIDLEIDSKKYKLFRISTIKDRSLVVSPQIKPIMEGSIKGSIDDIHISQHISGKNHIKIKNLKTKNYQIPSITQIANRKCKWYICINTKDKLPEDIFQINSHKSTVYKEYYLTNLPALPKGWFTIYITISNTKKRNKSMQNLSSLEILYKDFYVYISLCSGTPKGKGVSRGSNLNINPTYVYSSC